MATKADKQTILVVDNEAIVRESLCDWLGLSLYFLLQWNSVYGG